MKQLVKDAFLEARQGYSADVVVTNPEFNSRFLSACRARGLQEDPGNLNLLLLNLRKTGFLADTGATKRANVRNQEEFRFASEIAARYLERKRNVSLDLILCDPLLAQEFDDLAAKIAPGYKPFEYRWAALNLRKARGLKPELLARVVRPTLMTSMKVTELQIQAIPTEQGLYLFYDSSRTLYAGECQNLRKRLSKHLEHSDNKGLARWLWDQGPQTLSVEYQVLPKGTETRIRKAMEAELIRSRKPVFNISGADIEA